MIRVPLNELPLRRARSGRWLTILQRGLLALFLVQLVLAGIRVFSPSAWFGQARWPDGVLVLLAAATSLANLSRDLPTQNVLLAFIIIAFISGAVQTLGILTSIPFGPYTYTARMGQELFYPLPWAAPALWVVVIISSRGTARLILRPWRDLPNYGLWRIGIAVLLVVLFDLGMEPFAAVVKGYWTWHPTKLPYDWYGMPWVNSLGWALTALLILGFATPALINKLPVKQPPDYQPLAVWLLLNLLFLAGAIAHRLWPAAALVVAQSALVATFALLGARPPADG